MSTNVAAPRIQPEPLVIFVAREAKVGRIGQGRYEAGLRAEHAVLRFDSWHPLNNAVLTCMFYRRRTAAPTRWPQGALRNEGK
jgi:hypothetical protein